MFYKLILVYLLLIADTLNLCGKGCLQCTNNDCQICDNQNNYILINNQCLKQDLEHCLFSSKYDLCDICEENYFLRRDKKCQLNPVYEISNCAFYDNLTNCLICKTNYFLNYEGHCDEVKSLTPECLYYKDAVTCEICIEGHLLDTSNNTCKIIDLVSNCLLYNNPFTCDICIDRYQINSNLFLQNIGYFHNMIVSSRILILQNRINLEKNMPVCERQKQIKFCKTFKSVKECAKCQDGYFLSSPTSCVKNPVSLWTIKDSIVMNCFSFDSGNSCIMCYDGYYLSNQQCIKHEVIIPNCFIRSQSQADSCLICDPNYYRIPKVGAIDKFICQIRSNSVSFCKEYKIDEDKCAECLHEFIKHFNDIKCSKKLKECKIYNTAESLLTCSECSELYKVQDGVCVLQANNCIGIVNGLCSKCEKGFVLNENFLCVVATSSILIHKCAQYDFSVTNVTKCLSCQNNDVKINEKSYCVKGSSNCSIYDIDGSCLQCKKGYLFSGANCVEIDNTNKCDLFKGTSTTICLQCKYSHFLRADYQECRLITKPVNKTNDSFCDISQTDYVCDTCSPGFYPVVRGNIDYSRSVTCQLRSENPALINNCLYFNNNKCFLCRSGYYLNIGATQCVTTCSANQILNIYKLQCEVSGSFPILNCSKNDGKACFECVSNKPLLNFNAYNLSYFKKPDYVTLKTGNKKTQDEVLYSVENCSNSGDYTNLYIDENFRTIQNYWGQNAIIKEIRTISYQVTVTYSTLNCDNSKIYNFTSRDQFYKSVLSCHQCLNNYFLILNLSNGYRITDLGFTDQSFLDGVDEIETNSLSCVQTNPTIIDNCGLFSFSYMEENSNYNCVLCKPGYKPTYDEDERITNCTIITYCNNSSTFNICDQCNSNFAFGYNLEFQRIEKTKCISNNQNCIVFSEEINLCIECKEGYQIDYNTDLCVIFVVAEEPVNCISGLNGGNCTICADNGTDQRVTIFNLNKSENECMPQSMLPSNMASKNCLIFKQDQTCYSCPVNYLIHPNGSCVNLLSIPDCALASFVGNILTCQQCELGYTLSNNTCIFAITVNVLKFKNCVFLENNNSCGECDQGYSLTRTWDSSIGANVNYCIRTPLPDGCLSLNSSLFLSTQTLYCDSCEEFYMLKIETNVSLNESFCIEPSPSLNCKIMKINKCIECESNYYLDLGSGNCIERHSLVNNCVEFNKNSDSCLRQMENVVPFEEVNAYISLVNLDLLSPTEEQVLMKLPSFRQGLGSGIPNCEVYLSSLTCLYCITGYYYKDGNCIDVTKSTTDCKYYLNENTCAFCADDYLLFNNECKKVLALNCATIKDPNTCESCPVTFPILSELGSCEKPADNSEFCEIYYIKNNKWACKECFQFYYPDSNGICQPINFPIENCIKYSSLTTCLKCENGYYFRPKSLSCVPVVEMESNCNVSQEKNSCSICDLGYYLEKNICILCKNAESCDFCNPTNNDECLVCKSGYYMDNSGNCYKYL